MTQTITINAKGQKTINGLTLKSITSSMLRFEKVINWYNKKYNFEVPATQKQYFMALNCWDALKSARDILKAA